MIWKREPSTLLTKSAPRTAMGVTATAVETKVLSAATAAEIWAPSVNGKFGDMLDHTRTILKTVESDYKAT
jgi:hypothetical protein